MDRFYNGPYREEAFDPYKDTDFLQIMAIGTKKISDKVKGSDSGQFSVMYTPMATGKYE